jgi:hypothetical protein
MGILCVHKTQEEIWPHRSRYHVLTYAEEGFAPLNIHAEPAGLRKEQLAAFAARVNERFETGSLHPAAPISAVPRAFVRDMQDVNALRDQIVEFLRANKQTIKATKLICDFRTPRVAPFVVAAIQAAMSSVEASILEEVVIIE